MFLPTHKSHLDYVILSFLLVNLEIKVRHNTQPYLSIVLMYVTTVCVERMFQNDNNSIFLFRFLI